jgi:hypothetical protein
MEWNYESVRRRWLEVYGKEENKSTIFYVALIVWLFFQVLNNVFLVLLGASAADRTGFIVYVIYYGGMQGVTTFFMLDSHRAAIVANANKMQPHLRVATSDNEVKIEQI